jgi:hypothetical protein
MLRRRLICAADRCLSSSLIPLEPYMFRHPSAMRRDIVARVPARTRSNPGEEARRLPRLAAGIVAAALLAIPVLGTPADATAQGTVVLTGLQTENLTEPIGIDSPAPLLSWQEQTKGRTSRQVQTAYQVRAATTVDRLRQGRPDLWDTGRMQSSAVSNIPYGGALLTSRDRVVWEVRVWTGSGGPSAWSSPAWFEMGLLGNSAWRGQWIENSDYSYFEADGKTVRPLPVFAKGFTATGRKVASARLYMTGLGMYSATVDDKPVGKAVLEPGQTTYADEVQYRTYDVTGLIKHGSNEVAVQTGSGTYPAGPQRRKVLLQRRLPECSGLRDAEGDRPAGDHLRRRHPADRGVRLQLEDRARRHHLLVVVVR